MKINSSFLFGTLIVALLSASACGIFQKSDKPEPVPRDSADTVRGTEPVDTASAIREVSSEQFSKLLLLDEVQLLDVRTPEEYADGHIAGSELMNIKDADFASQIGSLDKEKPVLVYCRSGKRSMAAAKILEQAGFTKIISLEGGILDWKKQELPIEK